MLGSTNTLLPNVSGNITRNATPCTPWAVFIFSPIHTQVQHSDSAKPSASRQASRPYPTPLWNRKPRISENVIRITIDTVNRTASPSTAPTSGADREIGRLRNRSNTPLAKSSFSPTPVPMVANMMLCASRPGSTNCRYCRQPPSPAIAPPNTNTNSTVKMIGWNVTSASASGFCRIRTMFRQASVRLCSTQLHGVRRTWRGRSWTAATALIGVLLRPRWPRRCDR